MPDWLHPAPTSAQDGDIAETHCYMLIPKGGANAPTCEQGNVAVGQN